MKTKVIIQRSLPLTQTYNLIETFYSSAMDGGGHLCENCGRLISNIAKVQGETDKNIYYIGMDCAETLTGLKESFTFEFQAKAAFQAGKSARQAIMKMQKKAKENNVPLTITAETFDHEKNYYKEIGAGIWRTKTEPFNPYYNNFKQYPKIQWESHVLPMIKDLLS